MRWNVASKGTRKKCQKIKSHFCSPKSLIPLVAGGSTGERTRDKVLLQVPKEVAFVCFSTHGKISCLGNIYRMGSLHVLAPASCMGFLPHFEENEAEMWNMNIRDKQGRDCRALRVCHSKHECRQDRQAHIDKNKQQQNTSGRVRGYLSSLV